MKFEEIIQRAKNTNGGFVFFREPQNTIFTCLAQFSPLAPWVSPKQNGFVIAPFEISSSTTPVIIAPEEKVQALLPTKILYPLKAQTNFQEMRSDYAGSFEKVHHSLLKGEVQKVVLSRRQRVKVLEEVHPEQLFFHACQQNPSSFVALWWTSQSGLWLVATPEILVQHIGEKYCTMALAGTMAEDRTNAEEHTNWSEKNQKEQQAVTEYIIQRLRDVAKNITVSNPYSYKIGTLKHLRTDIAFSSSETLATLARCLHPTPAVCGTPLEKAQTLIRQVESNPRNYYSGYCGYVSSVSATLYVSLRCLMLEEQVATLYAGGGILPESTETDEWEETCRKLSPMLSLFKW